MRFFPFLLLGCAACVYAQQKPSEEGVPVPLKIASPAKASDTLPPDTVILQVGDTKITAKEFDALLEMYPMNQRTYAEGPGRQQFAASVARMLVLAEEARKRKLDETDQFKSQVRFAQDNLLAQALTNLLPQQIPVDDAALQKYFADHRCEYSTWKARLIVVRFQGSPLPIKPGGEDLSEEQALAKARSIRTQVADGADFAMLAREASDDPSTAVSGGEMGVVGHGQITPSFEDALCRLNPGDLSEPVKLPTGYHIIQLLSTETKDFAGVKAQLEIRYRNDAAKQFVQDLLAKTTVVKNPAYYAPPAPPSGSDAKKP